jgi:hypothetical protein
MLNTTDRALVLKLQQLTAPDMKNPCPFSYLSCVSSMSNSLDCE